MKQTEISIQGAIEEAAQAIQVLQTQGQEEAEELVRERTGEIFKATAQAVQTRLGPLISFLTDGSGGIDLNLRDQDGHPAAELPSRGEMPVDQLLIKCGLDGSLSHKCRSGIGVLPLGWSELESRDYVSGVPIVVEQMLTVMAQQKAQMLSRG